MNRALYVNTLKMQSRFSENSCWARSRLSTGIIIRTMKLLALDTSTEYLSLALWLDGDVIARGLLAGQQHSRLALPMLKEMLNEAGLALQDLDSIAFGEGPGSFTGLRIGCGIAQGLAFGAGLPVVGVSTLLALAQQGGSERMIACLDARMGEVYLAAYTRQDTAWLAVLEPGLYRPEDVPAVPGSGWHGIGSGWAAYGNILRERYAGQTSRVDGQAFPHARDIAALAAGQFSTGNARTAAEAAPSYIRNKVALKMSER
jgi:tRNA threonylcarbamoyladenosine biosynthesis protein TsaB